LDAAQTGHDGVEEIEQDQGGVLIVMQNAIARPIALAAVIVQPLQDRRQQLEVLEAVQLVFLDAFASRHTHGVDDARGRRKAQVRIMLILREVSAKRKHVECRNRIDGVPGF